MPCSDNGQGAYWATKDLKAARDYTDKLTQLLCELCGKVAFQDGHLPLHYSTPELETWWEKHQRIDKERG